MTRAELDQINESVTASLTAYCKALEKSDIADFKRGRISFWANSIRLKLGRWPTEQEYQDALRS